MIRRPPRSTRTDTLCPYTTLFRSSVDRREDRGVAADGDRALRVAGMLGEHRRDGLAELAAEATREAHALAVDVGAGLLEQRERFGILAELDADLGQHRLRVALDQVDRKSTRLNSSH